MFIEVFILARNQNIQKEKKLKRLKWIENRIYYFNLLYIYFFYYLLIKYINIKNKIVNKEVYIKIF